MALASLRHLGILAILAALSLSSAVRAAGELATASRLVPISELVGLDPTAVRARLTDVPADWPIRPDLVLKTSTGVLTFVSLNQLFQGPALPAAMAHDGAPGAAPGDLVCTEYASIGGQAADLATLDILMFRDGRLEAAFAYTDSKPTISVPRPGARWAEWEAFYDQPVSTPYIARPGDLLLADGLGFMARWEKVRMAASDRLGVGCLAKPAAPPTRAHPQRSLLGAFDDPGVVLIPLAVTLPFKNHERRVASERGAALLTGLRPGDALNEPVARFAEDHAGVQMFTGGDPAYVVLKIDMGAPSSRHIDNTDLHALVGVRENHVEWIAPAGSFALGVYPGLLCLGPNARPDHSRPGCAHWPSGQL